ncbi:MAG: tRNA uridine-5-carboxymethylaminomethyl(34) synthesis GTPase MnmE [Acidobacteria bacterium]|nr:tRNA uridine-5-carboxymethylaminomethyl(34) synthesis GTPase MnmE [Acidobacteriota bacterium]
MHLDDTIVAIATPPGRGGIGVIRLAGPEAKSIALPMLRLKHPLEPGRAVFCELIEPDPCGAGAPARDVPTEQRNSGANKIDEVVVTYFAKPNSYTTDDILEISAHGSPVILRHVVELCLARGARLAEPGEFTMRAFLNGRIDLAQAEAVRDLIDAQTLYQAKVAAQQLEGALSRRLRPVKQTLVELIARLEAGIDFAEDDVSVLPSEQILRHIAEVRAPLAALAASFAYGKIVHQGLTLAIVGRPNVGKSSLFNRLVERERAIVTATPGTTRDLVTETVAIGGIPVQLVDTAGIRHALDEAESIGIRKSMEALADADLVLVVLDASQPATREDEELLAQAAARSAILVKNKVDLLSQDRLSQDLLSQDLRAAVGTADMGPLGKSGGERTGSTKTAGAAAGGEAASQKPASEIAARRDALTREAESREAEIIHAAAGSPGSSAAKLPSVATSTVTGEGIAALRAEILRHIGGDAAQPAESGFLTNVRHQKLVEDSLTALAAAQTSAAHHIPHEMLLLDLYAALRALDEITGATTNDDILNLIFSTFCIGK